MDIKLDYSIGYDYKHHTNYLVYKDFIKRTIHKLKCPYCGSSKIKWANWYEIKELDLKERFKCKRCKKEFFLEEIKLGEKLE